MQLHSQAQWESLPLELQDHILWRLGMYNRGARLVSKAFAAKLRRWLWLSCPHQAPWLFRSLCGGRVALLG